MRWQTCWRVIAVCGCLATALVGTLGCGPARHPTISLARGEFGVPDNSCYPTQCGPPPQGVNLIGTHLVVTIEGLHPPFHIACHSDMESKPYASYTTSSRVSRDGCVVVMVRHRMWVVVNGIKSPTYRSCFISDLKVMNHFGLVKDDP